MLFVVGCAPVQAGRTARRRYLSPLEQAIIHETNLARTNPRGYGAFLERSLSRYDGKLFQRPGKVTILTQEGPQAVREAIRFLRTVQPVGALQASHGLSWGAQDHANDQGHTGATGHQGRDGSQAGTRVNRYGQWQRSLAENITYRSDTARAVVMALIVDDGVPSRGHRTNLFQADFQRTGVACGYHKTYDKMCVMVYAGAYTKHDVAP